MTFTVSTGAQQPASPANSVDKQAMHTRVMAADEHLKTPLSKMDLTAEQQSSAIRVPEEDSARVHARTALLARAIAFGFHCLTGARGRDETPRACSGWKQMQPQHQFRLRRAQIARVAGSLLLFRGLLLLRQLRTDDTHDQRRERER